MIPLLLLACTGKPPTTGDTGDTGCTAAAWFVDQDGDGFGGGEEILACTAPAGAVLVGGDCDDGDAAVHPGAEESCNGLDDDCDEIVDPDGSAGSVSCYSDYDGDGYGTTAVVRQACACPEGFSEIEGDCDDEDPESWPGASEIWYDGVDQDCMGLEDEYDADGDGFDLDEYGGDDCDDTRPDVNPDARGICGNGLDDDCDGEPPDCGLEDLQQATSADLVINRIGDGALGQDMQVAGDSDGDGWNEVLLVDYTFDTERTLFRLVELHEDLMGAHEVEDLALATFVLPDDGTYAFLGRGPGWTLANVDLDGDGYLDYVTAAQPSADSRVPGRIDLVSGPVEGELYLDEAVTVRASADEAYGVALTLVTQQGVGDWTIALGRTQGSNSIDTGPDVVLLTAAHFSGEASFEDAIRIDAATPWAAYIEDDAVDLDGDGIRDLATSHYEADVDLETVTWRGFEAAFLSGPFEEDRSVVDADVVIDGTEEESTNFGEAIEVMPDRMGSGYPTVAIAAPRDEDADDGWTGRIYLFDWPLEGELDVSEADVVLQGPIGCAVGDLDSLDAGSDLDGDGVTEVVTGCPASAWPAGTSEGAVFVVEPPESGTYEVSDAESIIYAEKGDGQVFGDALLAGYDLDADGHGDLLVGGWHDPDPEYYSTWGRIHFFNGGPGGY